MAIDIPPQVTDAAPGMVGALLSLRNVRGGWADRALAFIGGAAIAYWGAGPAADWLQARPGTVLIARLLLGYFSMAALAKCWGVLEAIDAAAIGRTITCRINRIMEPRK